MSDLSNTISGMRWVCRYSPQRLLVTIASITRKEFQNMLRGIVWHPMRPNTHLISENWKMTSVNLNPQFMRKAKWNWLIW